MSPPEPASAVTELLRPEPTADQLVPFHRATRLAKTSPTMVKSPPMNRLPEASTTAAETAPFAPGRPPMLIQLASLNSAAARLKDDPVPSATAQSSQA